MKKQYTMAGITVLLWSTLSAVSKLLLNNFQPMPVLFYTSGIAALTLLVINIVLHGPGFFRIYSFKDYKNILFLGTLGLFFYNALYYVGLSLLTSQIACIINYMWPMMIILFSCIILKEPLTIRKLLSMTISFLGMIVICAQGSTGSSSSGSLMGMAACFLAAICYGLYSVFNKKNNYDQFIMLFFAFMISTVLSGIYCGVTHTFFLPEISVLPGMLWIGIFVNAIAYVLWGIALNTGQTAKISILAYLCPFLSLIFGRILLKEQITFLSLVGLILIIGGVLIQTGESNNTASSVTKDYPI